MAEDLSHLPMFQHQEEIAQFWSQKSDIIANFSDAGTGKTRAMLEGYKRRATGKRALVLAPLSILEPAWGQDIEKWTPDLTYSIAYAKDRAGAFNKDTDIVIMNHDGIKWLKKNPGYLENFDTIIVDESTAFKNRTAARTKALFELRKHFQYRGIMTGTPDPNGLMDFWAQIYFLDNGVRLTPNFFHYSNSVTTPVQVGPDPNMVRWEDKAGMNSVISQMLSDITKRYSLEECTDMPENLMPDPLEVTLPKKVMDQYNELLDDCILSAANGEISAINAAAKFKKLQQLVTGCVYDNNGNLVQIYEGRYELAIQLASEVEHAIIAFNFRHERDGLIKQAKKAKLSYAYIDGSVPVSQREQIVRDYQEGKLDIMLCHPQSAGHGLTLTRGTRTIWCSPTYNAEHFEQLNRRVYRTGQTKRTDTLRIMAKGTVEKQIYQKLMKKHGDLKDTLGLLKELSNK